MNPNSEDAKEARRHPPVGTVEDSQAQVRDLFHCLDSDILPLEQPKPTNTENHGSNSLT